MLNIELEGFDDLVKVLMKLQTFPKKHLLKVVKKNARIILNEAKANAPKGETGILKRSMTLKTEKSKLQGKKVVQITFNKKYNEQLVKISKEGNRSYYPASQEYGWITRSGKKVAGKYFLRNAANSKGKEFSKGVIDEMMALALKEWKSGNRRKL